MATFSTLSAIFSLAGLCLVVQAVSLQGAKNDIGNRITDLSTRVRRDSGYSFRTRAGQEQQTDLLDIVLVASVDGKLHALNRTSGDALWSMSSSFIGEVPATLGPLIRTQHPPIDPDLTDDNSADQEVYVIEPQSGEIYVMSAPDAPLQRLPFTMPQLVDMSPFSFSGEADNRVFVGKKETSLLLIELETGKVKATLDSECPWDPFEDLAAETSIIDDLDLDELEGSKPVKDMSKPTEVFIGRTDYHISIRTRPSSSSPNRIPVQKLSFSTYGPNNQDNGLQALYRRTADDMYIEPMPNGKVISFRANVGPAESDVPSHAQPLWAHPFPSPIVAVFDVLRTPTREHPFVLLQPRPRLEDILPSAELTAAAKQNRLPNLESAYVGLVEETGSLYAMSPDRYPLVIFGDTNQQDDFRVGRSIDPPPDVQWELDSDRDLPADIDSVAKRAKLRQICANGGRDPRCLTGIKRLESSRLSRLLDGAPSVPYPPYHHYNSANGHSVDEVAESISTSVGNASIFPHDSAANLPGSNPASYLGSTTQTFSIFAIFCLTILSALAWLGLKRRSPTRIIPNGTPAATPAQNGHASTEKGRSSSLSNGDTPSSANNDTIAISTAVEITPSIPVPIDLRPETPTPRRVVFSDTAESPLPTPKPLPEAEDAGENAVEGDESDGDAPATPGRRKTPRRKRGKKKKPGAVNLVKDEAVSEEREEKTPEPNGEVEKAEDVVPVVSPSAIVVSPQMPKPVAPSLVVSDSVLGFGSHGTVVFKGSLQGRAVAVKRLLQDFVTLAAREVNVLQESDDHPNVIRYYYQEHHANFLYIALELCPASLADVIERPDQFRDISNSFDPKRALRQITSGLRHLHALKIVHRDIKPQNILISHAKKGVGESAGHRMLISDFGLCKKLEVDQTSFLPTAHGAMAAGTVGWRAPEILRGEVKLDESGEESMSSRGSIGAASDGSTTTSGRPTRLTKAVDIFALGCLFYYVLTNGGHPFGDRFERESNIMKNAKRLEGLESFGEEGSEAVDLIEKMLNPDATRRPDTATCLLHPYFWDPGKRLNFLQDASDRFEIMCRDPRDPNLIELEKGAFEVVGADWNARLDRFFIENLGKFRKYDGKSVQDLLRALRNKKHHYQDLPDNVKRQVGPMPEGFLSYFTRRFPRLFLHVHAVIAASSLQSESMFRTYFELTD